MSDKSFGDPANRNIVKNPLLSTAVTGLSIEDLTHNAVLLPAIPSQELTVRQDKQQGAQMHTPRYPNTENTNVPYGDAKPNTIQFNTHIHANPSVSDTQTFDQFSKTHEIPPPSQSKAPPKSDDDFDVNEYFARLQGTRYVSAPINSNIKEDQSANLQEEENLEEINLNEPDKGQNLDDVQQSLTADIAQNFSQLPTVIPQMASVVFSSFSSMLSLKSREQTPDADNKIYQEPIPKVDITPMMASVPEVPKDVAPPPLTEPPSGIATSYRMTSKRKVYAQIPGLSSGDHHVPTFNPPPSSHAPPNYFIPDNVPNIPDNVPNIPDNVPNMPLIENKFDTTTVEPGNHAKLDVQYSIPQNTDKAIAFDQNQIVGAQLNLMVPTQEKETILSKQEDITMVDITKQSIITSNTPSTPIIPPPPMFSNMQRDSQTSTGKTVLPPSIARRIAGTQPVIKTQTMPCFIPQQNILIPTIPGTNDAPHCDLDSTVQKFNQMSNQKSEFTNTIPPNPYSNLDNLIMPPSGASWNEGKNVATSEALEPNHNISEIDQISNMPAYSLFYTEPLKPADSNIFLNTINPISNKCIEQRTDLLSSNNTNVTADYINPYLKENQINEFPTVLNSSAFTQADVNMNRVENFVTDPRAQMSHNFQANTSNEPMKPLTEPPKVTGNVNYRMSKKKPQYYSGPIVGVGSISNDINSIKKSSTYEHLLAPGGSIMPPSYTAHAVQNFSSEICNINKPMNVADSQTTLTQQEQVFSTPFDLSRQTTDSYDEHDQDSKNFSIIGSLKSKINSLDVIKNTITNLLDPTYNLSKNNDLVIPENNNTYAQDHAVQHNPYLQSNIEQFRYQPSNNPKPADQQYQYNAIQYEYGFLSTPKLDTNFAGCAYYEGFHDPRPPVEQSSKMLRNVIFKNNHKGTEASNTHENISDYVNQNFSTISAPLNQDKIAMCETEQTAENIFEYKLDNTITTSDKQSTFSVSGSKDTKDFMSTGSDTGINIPKLFEHSGLNVPMETGAINIQKIDILDNSNKEPLQSKINPTESIIGRQKTTIVTGNIQRDDSPRDFFNDLPKISQVLTDPSSKGFFDKETSIVLPFQAKILEENINKSITTVEPLLSKITIPSNIQPRNKLVENQDSSRQLNVLEKMTTKNSSEMTDILSPVELKNNEENQEYTLFRSENKTTNNSNLAPMFSLFETSHPAAIPLFDISSMPTNPLPLPTNSKNVKDLEIKPENTLTFNITDAAQDRSLFENISTEVKENFAESPISELNICETCREVKKPEGKEADDLTTQLIENITAPIQLENPVEYPVDEDFVKDSLSNQVELPAQFITAATEDIIDNMKIQPPDDVLNGMNVDNAILNYGWSANEAARSTKALPDHDYGFQVDAKSIGFFPDKCVFLEDVPANASDEIKAEFQNAYDDTPILPRQMSVPSAPPEEDSKSDESGLDVHSIEQDAKKDFPIYEEFIAEPSETDDHKIEYREREKISDSSEPPVDTFTNRVERYKKGSDNTTEIKKEIKTFDLPTSTSPAITIASYFDTGNYAVENHYKNSLTSPSSINTFITDSNTPMRIPPGFEEEYHRRLSGISSQDTLPVLQFQKLHVTADINSLCTMKPLDQDNICDANVETMIKELIDEDHSPTKTDNKPALTILPEFSREICKENIPGAAHSFESDIVKKEEIKLDSLPDPINFFSSNTDSAQESDAYNDFSRLSSYFTSPPKPEHSKSFFELSQSQNHYRHKPSQSTFDTIQSNVKTFFENPNSNNNLIQNKQNENIPQNISQQMSLVRDLTSTENLQPNEDIVRTVNYFTVDNIKFLDNDLNKREVGGLKQHPPNKTDDDKNDCDYSLDTDENKIENIVFDCKHCCEINEIRVNVANTKLKIRKNMDNNNSDNRDVGNIELKKEGIRKSMTVNFCDAHQDDADDRIVVMSENRASSEYTPVKHHWFYKVDYEGKSIWRGFSVADSRALEIAFNSPDLKESTLVATDGGRYDVNVVGRLRTAVYWSETPTNVMRCSWFYKGTSIDPRYIPYPEDIAEKLEEEYRHGVTTGEWHRRLMLSNNELVVMHGPSVMVHFVQNTSNDAFATSPQSMMRPRVVRRGCAESEIEDTEPSSIDHLLLLCHGVGSACDMRFRPVEEVVNDFRTTSLQLIQSHYKSSYDSGLVGRVEVLPISWHASLHTGVGVDSRLAAVTLDSIPRLRNFTNDTILDVLFYTSPVFCQLIIDTVCSELNRIYNLFKSRNPDFKGGVSLGGHSLGSVILYDLLCHQIPVKKEQSSTDKTYMTGTAGTGQPTVKYPALKFEPDALYALGSPIAIFECIRGVETLGKEFCLPTCKNFFNIFHPYDPIAYRIEPMINPVLRDVKPYLIPHHKGRKRMHLELKDTMARVGADLKQKVIESIKSTWSSMWKSQPPTDQHLEKVVEEEIEKEELTAECKEEVVKTTEVTVDMLGQLNAGRRVDLVLQEAPFEMINEYLFAMSSHVCYWESEDTMLVMLREIYNALGVSPDCSLPQHTMSVERSRTLDDSVMLSPDSPSTSRSGS